MIPPKRHICACRLKGVRRDSGGWIWVRMGAGGCISIQQTWNKANRGTDRTAGYNFGKGVGGEIGWQGWRGRHMTATDHPGGFWRRKGYRSRVTCIYEQASRQTRKKQQEKRKNKQIRRCLQSGQEPQREETNIKIAKKNSKRETSSRTSNATRDHYPKAWPQANSRPKQQKTVWNGDMSSPKNLQQQTVQN